MRTCDRSYAVCAVTTSEMSATSASVKPSGGALTATLTVSSEMYVTQSS